MNFSITYSHYEDGPLKLDYQLTYEPERIVSIVSASRSGSTIMKWALCLHPDLCSLAGEEEPYYKLAQNGYPWHVSDEFHSPNNPEYIKLMIANELHNYESEFNRDYLQTGKIEEPPFVLPIECRRTPTLVLKTPQNCYRRGVLEYLYPNAQFISIVIKRHPCAVVNGLLDGWSSPFFEARETPDGWWKFDMPPGWNWDRSPIDRALHQWQAAAHYIADDYQDRLCETWYETFNAHWRHWCDTMWDRLDLPPHDISKVKLPMLMNTSDAGPDRWKTQRPWLEQMIGKVTQW